MSQRSSSTKGFRRASSLISKRVKEASETRGFAQARLLTHWEEVVGMDTAKIAQPVKVSYIKKGLGGTLTLLCNGANAPFVEMEKEQIRIRVNSVYGYNAITEIKITQIAAMGFSKAQAIFEGGPTPHNPPHLPAASRVTREAAKEMVASIHDAEFTRALEALAKNVLSKQKT